MDKFVSFDIFDTLIVRNVSRPIDVFKIVENVFNGNYAEEYFPFVEERIKAEKECRRCSVFEEVNLDEIYAYMNIDEEKREKLKQIETDVEYVVCNTNSYFYKIYKRYQSAGYKIILISDMYLDTAIIKSILTKCGYTEYSSLFVSSEVRKMKHSTNLYSFVLEVLGIKGKDLLHYGNNFKVDYLAPKKLGIKAKWYRTHVPTNEYLNYTDNFVNRIMYYDITDGSVRHDIGYRIMGPLGVGFCSWIYKYSKKLNKDKIIFLSRDGYVFSEIYKKMFPDENVSYLRVSRRSLRNASLADIDSFNAFIKTVPPFKEYSVNMLLDILEIEKSSHIYRICEEKFDFELYQKFPIEDFFHNTKIKELYYFIKKEKEQDWRKQKEYLKRYLIQEEVVGNVAIVDLSFKGTAFGLLAKFCQRNNININLDGFVLGKIEGALERIGDYAHQMHGWIFEEMKGNPIANVLLSHATLYEKFFFDNTGTTLKYTEKNGIIIPVLDNNNQENINLPVIAEVRLGIYDFVNKINEFFKINDEEITKSCCMKYLVEFLLHPFNKHINIIGEMIEDNVIVHYIARPQSLKFYRTHPSAFFADLKVSFWKQAFLYRVFKIKIVVYFYNMFYMRVKRVNFTELIKMRKWLKNE